MRIINVEALNELIMKFGGVRKASLATGISESWLKQAKRGDYKREPNHSTILALCNASGFLEDQLLKPVRAGKRSKAS